MEAQDLEDRPDPRARALAWVVAVLLAVGFGACIAKGANEPSDPAVVQSKAFPDFSQTAVRLIASDGKPLTPTEICLLLAVTDRQHQQGLMGVTDLKGYAGMLFRFAFDSVSEFYMKDTPMPLSVAWFDAAGKFVSAADMPPCPPGQAQCPRYGPKGTYRYALEVPLGQLAAMGIGPGTTLQVTGPCTPT